ALKKMKAGEILEVCIDYTISMERIPEAVRAKGHEVLEIEEVGNSEWKIYIKVN
ncbi:MAG: sulfurtransferase TusA family protein, partial [Kosmotogaceae bacterium]